MSLIRSTLSIASLTFVSRIFGFLRDVMIANAIGASWLSDAFFVAFKIPNFFRRLFAEGAFNAAFVPQFAGLISTEGKPQALRFASEAMSVLLVILILLNALFLVFMPWLTQWFAPGFVGDQQKFGLTVELSRICFPYILFISLVSLLGGILNSLEKFAVVAFSPILLNLCLIFAITCLTDFTKTPAHALSIGVTLAGITQFLWLVYSCRRVEALPSLLAPRLTGHVRKMLKLIAPAALGAGVAQINLFIDLIFASNFKDGVSYLYYADRMNELPLGVIGIAVSTALLPTLSKQIRSGNMEAAYHSMNRAIELVTLFALPATLALITIPEPIIKVMYEHGAFTAADTAATYRAMVAFAVGLPSFVLIKIFASGFYASENTRTPFIVATFCVVINLCLNYILMQFLQHVGLALATSIAGWFNAITLGILLHKRGLLTADKALKRRVPRMFVANGVMVAVLIPMHYALDEWLDGSLTMQAMALCLLVGTGMVSYFVAIIGFKAVDRSTLKTYLRRSNR